MSPQLVTSLAVLFVALAAGIAQAVTIDMVPVGNPGNAGEWSGESYGGYGPDRICGGVDYTYNIGKHEVTAGQYAEFLNAVAKTDTYGLYNASMDSDSYGCQITQQGTSSNYTYDFSGRPSGDESDWANRSVNFVSWYNTLRFANWLHNGQPTGTQDTTTTEDGAYDMSLGSAVVRKSGATVFLPSEDEWYKAAYHKNDGVTGNYFDYPSSSDSVPGRDMTETTNPGNNANYANPDHLIGSPYYRTEVGEFQSSVSPYGTFDQGGNVFEWNEAAIGSSRGLRGGSFQDPSSFMQAVDRHSVDPTYDSYGRHGFRVASVPEPGSIFLSLAAAISLLVYAWRRRRS